MNRLLPSAGLLAALLFTLAFGSPASAQGWINELHYDNDGGDVDEFVEVVLPGGTDPMGYTVQPYNGNGGGTDGAAQPLPSPSSTSSGFDVYLVDVGLQNGAPDGVALCFDNGVSDELVVSGSTAQFLSYEGSFVAVGGCADGAMSTDIGVNEPATTPVGQSLQLGGTGGDYDSFSWQRAMANTAGSVNTNQTFEAGPVAPTVQFEISADEKTEGDQDSLYVVTVTLTNADAMETADVEVNFDAASSSETATSADIGDFTVAEFSLGPGSDSGTFSFLITGDDIEEPGEDFVFELSIFNQTGGVELGSPATFTLTINDNDAVLPDNALVISEFMADPTTPRDTGEWVELFNNTESAINLFNYTLRDIDNDSHRIVTATGGPLFVDPGSFIVLCRDSEVMTNNGISCDYEYSSFQLANDQDIIVLEDPNGNVVDFVEYNSAWFSSGLSTVYTGSPNGDNNVLGNWAESISREGNYNDDFPLGDDGSPGTNGVHANLVSPFGVDIMDYCYAVANGNWNTAAIWANCSDGVPGPGDAAAILEGVAVTVTEPTTVSVVVVEAGPFVGVVEGGSEAARGGSEGGLLLIDSRLDASVVTVSGSAIVSATGALTIATDLSVLGSLTTNDAVTLLATANGPAHYTNEIFGSINGTLTAEREYVDALTEGGGSFRGIFPPLAGVTFTQLADDFQTQGAIGSEFPDGVPNLYRFEATTQQFFPITDFGGELDPKEFDPDSGYVFYMFDFDIPSTWDVTGTIRDEYSLDLVYNVEESIEDYNWVPQPFAGPLDFKELFLASTLVQDNDLNATLYVLDPETEEFRLYNAITDAGANPGDGGAGRYVAPFQSFVVRTVDAGATLNYDYDLKDTGESALLVGRSALDAVQDDPARDGAGQADEVAAHVRLELEGEGEAEGLGSQQTYLVFYEQGAEGYDAGDAGLLYPFSADYAALVLMDEAGQELAMDARGLDVSIETFRARVATTQPGTYTLSWPTFHEIPSTWDFVLLDTETGTEVDLREQSAYTFAVGGPTAARRETALSKLRPDQFQTSERFVITVRALATAGEDAGTAPGTFALEDAYPNPFATTATIPYVLPQAADIRLTVYDVLGREVATLAEGAHEAGRHTATVSGHGLSGGVYFVRMTADGFAATKKFVVLN